MRIEFLPEDELHRRPALMTLFLHHPFVEVDLPEFVHGRDRPVNGKAYDELRLQFLLSIRMFTELLATRDDLSPDRRRSFLAVLSSETARLIGLDLGADDYVVKPGSSAVCA